MSHQYSFKYLYATAPPRMGNQVMKTLKEPFCTWPSIKLLWDALVVIARHSLIRQIFLEQLEHPLISFLLVGHDSGKSYAFVTCESWFRGVPLRFFADFPCVTQSSPFLPAPSVALSVSAHLIGFGLCLSLTNLFFLFLSFLCSEVSKDILRVSNFSRFLHVWQTANSVWLGEKASAIRFQWSWLQKCLRRVGSEKPGILCLDTANESCRTGNVAWKLDEWGYRCLCALCLAFALHPSVMGRSPTSSSCWYNS